MDTSEPTPVSRPQPTEPATPPPAAPEAESPAPAPTPRRSPLARLKQLSRRQLLLLGVAGILVLAGIGGSIWAYSYYHSGKPTAERSTATSTTTSTTLKATKTIDGVTFLSSAKKLDNLHLFTNYDTFFESKCLNDTCTAQTDAVDDSDVAYYQIGTTSNGQSLLDVQVSEPVVDVSSKTFDFIVEQSSDSTYTLLAIPSGVDSNSVNDLQKTLASSVTLDTATDVSALHFPKSLTLTSKTGTKITLTRSFTEDTGTFSPAGLDQITAFNATPYASTVFATNDTYTAYELNESPDADYRIASWYVGFNNMYVSSYMLEDSFSPYTSTASTAISWTAGDNTSAHYTDTGKPTGGCGYSEAYVTLPAQTSTSTLTKVGTGPNGETVYELPDDSPLLKTYADRANDTTSIADLQAKHGVIVVATAAGELGVYVRDDIIITGGCGEPVVYLYPTQPTYVDVQVGAKVVTSAPAYPAATGWQNVLARPNGQLTYQGKSYSSLLWEGYGNGQYPAITSGTVVPGNQAAATVRAEMKELGFLPNEINDFMAFWGPKLPHTPYVRLTWFGTNQVQALAPLTVWPHPNTVLRAFLDFQGLQQPISIPAQQLTGTPRRGFTVVEWGGLLRDGIN